MQSHFLSVLVIVVVVGLSGAQHRVAPGVPPQHYDPNLAQQQQYGQPQHHGHPPPPPQYQQQQPQHHVSRSILCIHIYFN